MRILRTTYTLTVDIEPAGEVASFIEADNVTVTVEWVDV